MAYTVVDKGSKHFNIILRNGGGGTFTGLGFQPDLVWQKARSTASSHYLHDAVRGVQKALFTNSTSSETTYTDQLTSFDTDGFTVNAGGDWGSGTTVVDWCWKANGAGSSNTAGSITSTVSANTTAGFSIVNIPIGSVSGTQTFGHGLGVAPKFIIYKVRGTTDNWSCYHASLGATKHIELNLTNASATSSAWFANTEPTSTVATMACGGANWFYANQSYIAYCFAEVKGFSKFGSYTGNGNADGTFVYTGFTPAWLMIKESNASGAQWYMYDNKRSTFNLVNAILYPNLSNAEGSGVNQFDFYSNGFKARSSNTDTNNSGNTYIYACFASNPFVSSKGIAVTAR